jgi:hypothetical protein
MVVILIVFGIVFPLLLLIHKYRTNHETLENNSLDDTEQCMRDEYDRLTQELKDNRDKHNVLMNIFDNTHDNMDVFQELQNNAQKGKIIRAEIDMLTNQIRNYVKEKEEIQ